MSDTALLRRAAKKMRRDVQEASDRGDEHAVFVLAVAVWLNVLSRYPMDERDDERTAAEYVARAYLGEAR